MSYEKRVCVLKQIKKGFSADGSALSGAVYCERLGDTLTVTPKLAGAAPVKEGRYGLVLRAEEKTLLFELNGNLPLRRENAPSVKNGFAALVVYLRGEAEPVAFGSCGSAPSAYEPLLAAVKEKPSPAVPLPPFETPAPVAPNVPRAPGVPLPDPLPFRERALSEYDDEAIASVDYYSHADEEAPRGGGGQAQEEKAGSGPREDAADPLYPPRSRGSLTYYKELREKLDFAFAGFPRDDTLKEVFPQSEWVRRENALLGIVYRAGRPQYLCVAAERETPPPEMGENALFVPLAGGGVWMVFQDADTGEYVRVSLS